MTLTPLYPTTDALPLLADTTSRYRKLKTDGERSDQLVLAELLLGLREPVYTGRTADEIMYGVALQVQFQMERGVTPNVLASNSMTHPGIVTSYRNRYLSPDAAIIVARATGTVTTGFRVPPDGV